MKQKVFGGNWSANKLERVRKYLSAYTTILSKYKFKFAYIDAFAGTGYQQLKSSPNTNTLLFPELAETEPQEFLAGSALNALLAQPPFQTYIFVEKDAAKLNELALLKNTPTYKSLDIRLENRDCNEYLQTLCASSWKKHRAVLFLDPFGMQVQWSTLESIASTKAIDLWILFPLGVAVNRILKRDGDISPAWRSRLDDIFGSPDWYQEFYHTTYTKTLFGEESQVQKKTDFDGIGNYFVRRLRSIFPHVVDTPLYLYNSKNVPLYMLCFASHNQTAAKIAKDILEN